MSEVKRSPLIPHQYDGVDTLAKAHLFFCIVVEGIAALLLVLGKGAGKALARLFSLSLLGLFWWVRRLLFLNQNDQALLYYGIADPKRERFHAWITGYCFVGAIGFGIALWRTKDHWYTIATPICLVGFVFFTAVFFNNRKDDPVAYCFDGEED